MWPTAVLYFQFEPDLICEDFVVTTDYNGDGKTNFREYVPAAFIFLDEFEDDTRASNINCSACIGMDVYNV